MTVTAARPGAARSALWPALLPPSQHGQDDLCAVSARGTRVALADGRTVLCGTSGLWNVNLGYGDPAVESAVVAALREASYLSLFRREHRYARAAADALVELCGPHWYRRVMFATSGGSANDLAMKVARQYQAVAGRSRRRVVVGLQGSYHGLTFGAHALTGEALGQGLYGVDTRLVRHLPVNDVTALRGFLDRHADTVAAVVVEPVLGTGAVELSAEYVAELVRLRDQHDVLLVADEVATGFGRTGEAFASDRWPARPDLLLVSKALTNGTAAASAVLIGDRVAGALTRADATVVHAETQAGTPMACAAALAVIDRMGDLDLVGAGRAVAAALDEGLTELSAQPWLAGVTGRGCFRGLTLRGPDGDVLAPGDVPAVVRHVLAAGAVVQPGPAGIQLVPALVYTADEVTELLSRVADGMASFLGAAARGDAA
ncbi:daptide-type RiPP biosynthesis aminotransferase [uncultured Cellulomonas sp.]|uniref:daptide-type RiPP biosynthesis aminotransferase n=1 Tax=uncultured Cellulomonas sp. TaxID=189682 RepID=UPI002635E0BF|nr:daptide-type RiPP biosynthesis aminotransferase [uncultured Cellulomonas sp.]